MIVLHYALAIVLTVLFLMVLPVLLADLIVFANPAGSARFLVAFLALAAVLWLIDRIAGNVPHLHVQIRRNSTPPRPKMAALTFAPAGAEPSIRQLTQ